MLTLEFEARNAGHVAARLYQAAGRAGPNAEKVIRTWGLALQHKIQERAPVDTGRYRSRIRVRYRHLGRDDFAAVVASPDPQARRLELGFTGEDSLGRHYDDPPQPHFRPGVQELRPSLITALRIAAKRDLL